MAGQCFSRVLRRLQNRNPHGCGHIPADVPVHPRHVDSDPDQAGKLSRSGGLARTPSDKSDRSDRPGKRGNRSGCTRSPGRDSPENSSFGLARFSYKAYKPYYEFAGSRRAGNAYAPSEIHVSVFPDEGRPEFEKLFGDGLPEQRQQRIDLTGRIGGKSLSFSVYRDKPLLW